MAQRQQQPLMRPLLIVSFACVMVVLQFIADLTSPWLFLIKAMLPSINVVFLAVCLIVSVIVRKKSVLLATAIALTITAPFLLPRVESSASMADQDINKNNEKNLLIATFSTMTRTDNVDDILRFIDQERPDVLCLQELSAAHRERVLDNSRTFYPYALKSTSDQLILSKFPIHSTLDAGQVQAGQFIHPSLGGIKIINVHMPRPYLGKDKAWQTLFMQINNPENLVLCGDLNITPNNSLYELMLYGYGLSDSLTSGYGLTYPNAQRRTALFGPLIRIDYIFTRGFTAQNTRTINASDRSDHRAVLTHLTPASHLY